MVLSTKQITNFYKNNVGNIVPSFILIFSFVVTLYCQYPLLVNKHAINDDVRNEIYEYSKYRDKELFQNDFITDFYLKWNKGGLNIFYFIVSLFYDPIQFTKILSFFLCMFSALYMFKLGRLLGGYIVGLLAGVLYVFAIWSSEQAVYVGTGGNENFGILLFIIFMYYFLKKDLWGTSIILILESLFYPPALLISWMTYLIFILYSVKKGTKIRKEAIFHLIGSSIVIFLILSLKYLGGRLSIYGLKDIISMPEFYPGGRKALFFPTIYEQLTNAETGFAIFYPVKFLFFISILVLIFLKKKALNIRKEFWCLILSSLILYITATIMLYRLWGPSRYVRFSLLIFLVIFVSLNVNRLIQKIPLKRMRLAALLSFFFFTTILFIPRLYSDYSIAPYPELYKFLEALPKNVFIAGYPTSMDFVPVYSKRKVLINEETSKPMYKDFYPIIKERTYDFFSAYYSDSPRVIYNFCKKYNISHIVVERSNFTEDFLAQKQIYLNPFNDYIKKITKNKHEFALLGVPKTEIVYEKGDVFVVEVKKSDFWLQ